MSAYDAGQMFGMICMALGGLWVIRRVVRAARRVL